MMKRFVRKSYGEGNGQGMMEFALILPLLLALIWGVIEVGRMLFLYSAVLTSSREAARYGSAAGDNGSGLRHYEDCDGIRAASSRIGVFAGIEAADISIQYDHGPGNAPFASCTSPMTQTVTLGDRVVVSVNGIYEPIVPLMEWMGNMGGFPITAMTARSVIVDVAIEGLDDGELPVVNFTSSGVTYSETYTQTITVQVRLSAATTQTVSVPFSVSGSAIAGSDYTLGTASPLQIAAGSTSAFIEIDLIDDLFFEGNETIVLYLEEPITNAEMGTSNVVHIITIEDNEVAPDIYFSGSTVAEYEDDGPLVVLVLLSESSAAPVTFVFEDTGTGTATKGVDYDFNASTPEGTPLTISPGNTSSAIVIDIYNEDIYEGDETINLMLVASSGANLADPVTKSATIRNDDGVPLLSFSVPAMQTTEKPTPIYIGVKLNIQSGMPVTFQFEDRTALEGTATPGTDYVIHSTSPLTINPGNTTVQIGLTVFDDGDDDEEEETIKLRLLNPTGAVLTSPVDFTLHIKAGAIDLPHVSFNLASQEGTESIGTMKIVAQLDAITTDNVTVPFSLSGTATQGSLADYTITPSPVTIPAGSDFVYIVITVYNDPWDEDDETVIVTMGNPVNAEKGAITQHTATIRDNDNPPQVTFNAVSQTVDEGAGTATVNLSLTAISGKPVTVHFYVDPSSTADAGDYSLATASPLTIPAGSSSASITVNILEDTQDEATETVVLKLGTLTNATPGVYNTHTVWIADNDVPVCPSLSPMYVAKNSNKLDIDLTYPAGGIPSMRITLLSLAWKSGNPNTVMQRVTFGGAQIWTGSVPSTYPGATVIPGVTAGNFSGNQDLRLVPVGTTRLTYTFDKNLDNTVFFTFQISFNEDYCPLSLYAIPVSP